MKLSPWAVAMFRFITGSLTLFILMKLTGKRVELEPVDRWRFVTLAFLAVPVNQITFLTGIHYTPASHPALMYATTPAWVLLLAIWLRVEKLRWWKSAGIALAMIGVAILFAGELLSFRRENVFGDLLILVAVLSWSLYTALGKPIVERYGSLETTFLVITFGEGGLFADRRHCMAGHSLYRRLCLRDRLLSLVLAVGTDSTVASGHCYLHTTSFYRSSSVAHFWNRTNVSPSFQRCNCTDRCISNGRIRWHQARDRRSVTCRR